MQVRALAGDVYSRKHSSKDQLIHLVVKSPEVRFQRCIAGKLSALSKAERKKNLTPSNFNLLETEVYKLFEDSLVLEIEKETPFRNQGHQFMTVYDVVIAHTLQVHLRSIFRAQRGVHLWKQMVSWRIHAYKQKRINVHTSPYPRKNPPTFSAQKFYIPEQATDKTLQTAALRLRYRPPAQISHRSKFCSILQRIALHLRSHWNVYTNTLDIQTKHVHICMRQCEA